MEDSNRSVQLNSYPLVSIIVPIYNVENYLERCVHSLINQTYSNLEIILVDDGSTDNSGFLCDKLANIDSRIRVIHQKNKGLSGARNTGLGYISGDFVAFVDSDDWIEQEMLEKMVTFSITHSLPVVECDLVRKEKFQTNSGNSNDYISNIESRKETLLRVIDNKFFSVCRRIYSSTILKGLNFPEGKTAEDVYFTIEVLKRIDKIGYLQVPFYNYFIGDSNSITRSNYSLKTYTNTTEAILYFQTEILGLKDKQLSTATETLVFDICLFNYKNLFFASNLDKDKGIRRSLKKLMAKNYNLSLNKQGFERFVTRYLPISTYQRLFSLYKLFKKT